MARTAQPATSQSAAGPAAASTGNSSSAAGADPTATPATRACPTRADGGTPLFQHQVTVPQCMSKQRSLYHKCFTCAHLMARR